MEQDMQLLAKEGIQLLAEEEINQVTGGVTIGDILSGDVPWSPDWAERPVDPHSDVL
jgi:hypothetical protein